MNIKPIFSIALIVVNLLSYNALYANPEFHSESSKVPENIKELITGSSWHKGCPVKLDDLAYLKISYWGFDNKPHVGEIIVYKTIAQNTIDTFKDLFQIKFPIESMSLPERFSKEASLKKDNNTYAFWCRMDEQSPNKFSSHSYGIAMDINPVYNPAMIANNKVSPGSGKKYLNRKLQHQGMINENDEAFKIFTKRGWYWGGFFPTGVDYQHFQKIIIKHYLITQFQHQNANEQIITYGLTD